MQNGERWASREAPRSPLLSGRIPRSRPESLPVFDRRDERLDHFCVDEVTVELIKFAQPELVTRIAKIRGVRRIATQVSKELGQHK
jgi:hypothetical protein